MYIPIDTLVVLGSAASVVAAAIVCILKAHKWYLALEDLKAEVAELKAQHKKDIAELKAKYQKEIDELKAKYQKEIDELKAHHESDLKQVNEENTMTCYALSACLNGLQQLGANGEVPIAKDKLDKFLNQKAHH